MSNTTQLTNALVDKLKEILKERLVSVCLYGSAVEQGTENRPNIKTADAIKDINVLVVIDGFDTTDLEMLSSTSAWWERNAHALPLFLSKDEWHNASDIFAIEYADIKERHWLAYGEDLFSGIEVDTQSLRLICELEIYRKLVFLRQRLLLFKDAPDNLALFMQESIGTITVLLRGLLRVYRPGKPALLDVSDLYAQLPSLIPGFTSQPFQQIQDSVSSKRKLDTNSALALFKQYIDQISLVNQFLNQHHAIAV